MQITLNLESVKDPSVLLEALSLYAGKHSNYMQELGVNKSDAAHLELYNKSQERVKTATKLERQVTKQLRNLF